MSEEVVKVLQYGALGLLGLVLVGIGWGAKILFAVLKDGLNRLIEALLEKLNSLEKKVEDGFQEVHDHFSDSERRLTAEIQGRKPTPPPMKAYRPGGAE